MNITKQLNGSTLTIKLDGRLDTLTAPDFEKEILEISSQVSELILDFADLEYVSSAGLRVVLSAQKKMSRLGSMKVVSVCDAVMEVFEITGFADVLNIE